MYDTILMYGSLRTPQWTTYLIYLIQIPLLILFMFSIFSENLLRGGGIYEHKMIMFDKTMEIYKKQNRKTSQVMMYTECQPGCIYYGTGLIK